MIYIIREEYLMQDQHDKSQPVFTLVERDGGIQWVSENTIISQYPSHAQHDKRRPGLVIFIQVCGIIQTET